MTTNNDNLNETNTTFETTYAPIKGTSSDEDYFSTMRSLNDKQKAVYDHCMKGMYDDSSPMNIFITGGAGVGKSLLMRALHDGFTRFYVRQPNNSRPHQSLENGSNRIRYI